MITVRMPTPAAPRLVEALLVAAGIAPRPADPADRQAYLDLANALGDGLDLLPRRVPAAAGNVAAAATAGDTTNHQHPTEPRSSEGDQQ